MEKKGTITTFKPVMKADFDAVVYERPVTWRRKPAKSKAPTLNPGYRRCKLALLHRKGARQRDAMVNLTAIIARGLRLASRSFIAGKVVPQIAEVAMSSRIPTALFS
ncbi:MAG: hypothetical protein DRN99_09565 [Thermoproteota archaeon]|nr:MAG: hypothetical protein DRN99_09565 [Candidatus Korarchaeota archaeon]